MIVRVKHVLLALVLTVTAAVWAFTGPNLPVESAAPSDVASIEVIES